MQVVSINLKDRDKTFTGMQGKAGYYVSVETASSSFASFNPHTYYTKLRVK